ncbi:MAG: DNA methyltransferase, partial [Actinomycetota bacterium]
SNVWEHPALRGKERYKGSMQRSAPRTYKPTAQSSTHLNQKPLVFMRRMVSACTNPGDVVWEPFGGLCSASVAAIELGRNSYAAEPVPTFADLSRERLSETQAIAPLVSIQSVRSSSGSPAKTQEELDFADEA